MAPTPYKRTFSFTASVSANPNFVPAAFGVGVDAELDQIGATIGSLEASLAQIQRSDGALANGIVTLDSMATGLLATFQGYVAASAASASQAAASNSSAANFASTASTAAVTATNEATIATNAANTAGANALQTGKDVVTTGQNVAAAQSAQAGAAVSSAAAGTARDQAVAANTAAQTAETQAQAYASQIAASVSTAAAEANQATVAAQGAATSASTAATSASTAVAARQSAMAWATQQSGMVSDGVNPAGYSAYYWAQQALSNATATTIPNGSVTTAKLANGAVTAAILASGAVVQNIGNGSLTAAMLASGAALSNIGSAGITSAYLAVGAALANLVDGTVPASKLTNASIGTQQIANKAVTTALIADSAVTAGQIGAKAVGTAAIADGAVTDTQIAGVNASKATYTSALGGNARSVAARFDDMLSVGMFSSFEAAVAACPGRRLWVPAGSWPVSASLVVNSSLMFDLGASLSLAANVTITFNRDVDAPRSTIFGYASSTTCSIVFNTNTEIYPEWWGVTPCLNTTIADRIGSANDGNDYAAMLYAAASASTSPHVTLKLSAFYRLANPVALSGNIRIRGTGKRSSGLLCTGSSGLLNYTGSYDGSNIPTTLDLREFALVAMTQGSSGNNCGTAITAAWPANYTVFPTFEAADLLFCSEVDSPRENAAGYWGQGMHLVQTDRATVRDCDGVAYGNTTTSWIYVDNNGSTGGVVFECHDCNFQGGSAAVTVGGWAEEVIITNPAFDTQTLCINLDGSQSKIGGSAGAVANGVFSIRGGDLNGINGCIQVINWRWGIVSDVNAGVFTPPGGTAGNDVMLFANASGNNTGATYITVHDCWIAADNQSAGHSGIHIQNGGSFSINNNTFGDSYNGITIDGNKAGTAGGSINNNILNSSSYGNVGISVVQGGDHMISGNKVQGYGSGGIYIGANVGNTLVTGNKTTSCGSNPINNQGGSSNILQSNMSI